jgi:HEAT repeat protein
LCSLLNILECTCYSTIKLIDTVDFYIFPKKHSEKIASLIKTLTNDISSSGDRMDASQSLGTMGRSTSAIPQLIPLLEHSNLEVRAHAVKALGYMGKSAKHTMPQILALLKDPNSDVRYSAVKALGDMGELSKLEVPCLIPLLQDSDSMVRMTTIHILGYMGDSAGSAISDLIPLLTKGNLTDRIYTHIALERLGYEETL